MSCSFFQQLNEMLKEGKLQQDQNGALMLPQAETLEEYLQPPEPLPPMKEFFSSPYSKTSDVCFIHQPLTSELLFKDLKPIFYLKIYLYTCFFP